MKSHVNLISDVIEQVDSFIINVSILNVNRSHMSYNIQLT